MNRKAIESKQRNEKPELGKVLLICFYSIISIIVYIYDMNKISNVVEVFKKN